MSALGHFLEFSVPAPDLGASLDFYLRLGLTEVRVNDIRPRGYAAVTDGQIVIGLHSAGLDEPALTFVKPDLARHARALMDAGTDFDFMRLDDDQFHEVGTRTPDGQLLILLEAPTFSLADEDLPPPVIGRCTELALASGVFHDTRNFFELAGFLATDGEGEDSVLVTAPGLSLTIRPEGRKAGLILRFEPTGAWPVLLETRGLRARRMGHDHMLTSPEGTSLLLAGN